MIWYIRPLFLIPFCFFAYERSWTGVSITLFALCTSLFWFGKPEFENEELRELLLFEKEWLYSAWNSKKIILFITVPLSFIVLGLAFWKRSLLIGLGVIVLIAAGKIVWSLHHAGAADSVILVPAIVGLVICSEIIVYSFRNVEKKRKNEKLH